MLIRPALVEPYLRSDGILKHGHMWLHYTFSAGWDLFNVYIAAFSSLRESWHDLFLPDLSMADVKRQGFSFVASNTPVKALWELTSLTFRALISSLPVDGTACGNPQPPPPQSLNGLTRTHKEGFGVLWQGKLKYHKLSVAVFLSVPMDSGTANIYLTNGSGWRVGLFASRQLREMIKFEP